MCHYRPRSLGWSRQSFHPFKGSWVHLVSFPGESSSTYEASSVGQSFILGLIPRVSPGIPLISCEHHGVACSIFSPLAYFSKGLFKIAIFLAETNLPFFFPFSTSIVNWKKFSYPSTNLALHPRSQRSSPTSPLVQNSKASSLAAQPSVGLNVLPSTSRESCLGRDAAGLPAALRLAGCCRSACQ